MIRLTIKTLLERKFPALPVVLELSNHKIIFKAKSFSKLLYFFPFFFFPACMCAVISVLFCCFWFVCLFSLKIKILQYFPSLLCRTFLACETSGGCPAASVVEKSEVAVHRQHEESNALD